MVLPAKIFEIKEEVNMGLVVGKLKDFHEEELHQTESGETLSLATQILDLKLEGDIISGVFSKDFVQRRFFRRRLVEAPITEESQFWIKPFKKRFFIIASAPSVARGVKKLLTNFIASKLSSVLFVTPHAVIEVEIPRDVLRELHESNPQATRLIWFDEVDIPGVEKLCLAGPDLVDTQLYQEYIEHGKIWYVVFEVQSRGITVGITRNCVVTLFSKSTTDELVSYISEDVLALIR